MLLIKNIKNPSMSGEIARMEYKKYLEQYGGIGLEKQNLLFELIGESDWRVDLETGILSFSNGEVFNIQILGSYGYNAETWLWEWANSGNETPNNVLSSVLKLKALGEKADIEFFITPEFKCQAKDLHFIGIIATAMLGESAYFCGDYGSGIALMIISSEKIDQMKHEEDVKIVANFSSLISIVEIDHREAFKNYMLAKGYSLQEEHHRIVASKSERIITASFDQFHRVADLRTH